MLQAAHERYQPQSDMILGQRDAYNFNQKAIATIVGLIALGMPSLLWFFGPDQGCFGTSLSHHYYTPFWGTIFVGSLTVIGAVLFTYTDQNRRIGVLAKLAGVATLFIAVFPTVETGCFGKGQFGQESFTFEARAFVTVSYSDAGDGGPSLAFDGTSNAFELFGGAGTLHAIGVIGLFLFLVYFCFRVFTREKAENRTGSGNDARLTTKKKTRNTIYYMCGAIMLGASAVLAYGFFVAKNDPGWAANKVTLKAEAIALWAFGFSWVIKGKLFGMLTFLDDEV